ncbi:Serine/threonine-protein kinase 19 [Borealophlyctis nickersoniae]|nr:Serine/threonine-protein kinase 19 [Borealophlyctis nickersoniae]
MLACDYADQISEESNKLRGIGIGDVNGEGNREDEDGIENPRKRSKLGHFDANRDGGVLAGAEKDVFVRYLDVLSTKYLDAVEIGRKEIAEDMAATDEDIKQLMAAGFLTIKDVNSCWLSVRNAGRYWLNIAKGRNELLQALKKNKFHEILEKTLVDKKLRNSIVHPRLILMEMLGSGAVISVVTPMGHMIRLAKTPSQKAAFRW